MRLALILLFLVAACAPVRPWQRETLSRREMAEPPWPSLAKAHQHVYQVREAASGGYGAAGGGCGCN